MKLVGPYQWQTYRQVQARIDAIGSGLAHLAMAPEVEHGSPWALPAERKVRLVGLYSKNRAEWVIAEQACHAFGMADVPLYDTLGDEAIVHILAQTGMATVFTDAVGAAKLVALKAAPGGGGGALASFKFVVSFEEPAAADVAAAAAAGLTLMSFAALEAAGRAHPAPHAPPAPEDLAFICYTSGTTGMPKGAMILHRNITAEAGCVITAELGLCATDVHISYLPLAHIMERLIQTAFWLLGASVGFYQGDTLKITEDLAALRPTVFVSVPRLWNKIYDKITAGAAAKGGVAAYLFNSALEAKKYWLREHNCLSHSLWDRLVFKGVRARVGLDRVRLMITGSAPIAPHVMEFLRVAFGAHVCEGYGQTECSAASNLTNFHDQASLGHVGGPLACCEVRLESVVDMGYLASDTVHGEARAPCQGRGEVCYRGHNVFPGYFKDLDKTREALDADGWLHSGDVGMIDERGNLRIVDRKKNIFKLSQGEYVAAEKIENVCIKAGLVAQAFVYGDSLHSVLVGVMVPDADAAKAWARANGLGDKAAHIKDLAALPELKKAMAAELEAVAKEAKLQSFERVRDFYVEPFQWTPEDVLTPSFKLKRADAKKKCVAAVGRDLQQRRCPRGVRAHLPPPLFLL